MSIEPRNPIETTECTACGNIVHPDFTDWMDRCADCQEVLGHE